VIRDHRGGKNGKQGLVGGLVVIHAGGTHDLGDDDALRAVDDEGAARRHDGEIAHEDLLLLDLLGLLVAQPHANLQRRGVGGVPGFAFLNGILGLLIHRIVHKAQLKVAGIVGDDVHILEHLAQAGIQKPAIGVFLDLQQVRHILDLLAAGKALSQRFAIENIFWHWRTLLIHICERPAKLSEMIRAVLILLLEDAIIQSVDSGCRIRFYETHSKIFYHL